MTHKEAALDCFKKMDAEMLCLLLDNNHTYQDATKEVFVDKVNQIFEKLKSKGDTEILIENGSCACPDCKSETVFGYSFIGNVSFGAFILMFKTEHERIVDIYRCNANYEKDGYYEPYEFEYENQVISISDYYSIDIARDEKPDFKPTENYLLFIHNCQTQYAALESKKNTAIDINYIINWLNQSKELSLSCPLYNGKHMPFLTKYTFLKETVEFLDYMHEAEMAINDFEFNPIESKDLLIKWLIKYEDLAHEKLLLVRFYYQDNQNIENVHMVNEPSFILRKSDFGEVFYFTKVFDTYYREFSEEVEIEKEKNMNLLF